MRFIRPRLFVFALIIPIASISVNAQTSLQAEVSRGSDGHARVMLNNTYTADARAYIVQCEYPGANGQTATYMVWHEGIGGPPYTVWAGKSQRIGCPTNTARVEVKAVAYDDGKTEGDPQLLAALAEERQMEAQDVAEDIQILQEGITKIGTGSLVPGSSASLQVTQLATQFLERAKQHANTALGPVPQDYVCTSLARMLSSPVHKQPMTVLIPAYIQELQKFAAVLPKLVQTDVQIGTD